MLNLGSTTAFPALAEDVHHSVLANGLTVLLKVVPTAPVVTIQVWYQVGSCHEPQGWNGISHQLEHLMFKGTHSRPIQFGRLFSALGSDSNAFTSYEQTAYFNTAEAHKLHTLLALEADRMTQTRLEAAALDSEKGVVISELDGYDNDPSYRLDRSVMQALFPNHPYGLPVGGTPTDVANFSVEQVEGYYQTYYQPDNATLIVVGDFNLQDAQQSIAETFGQIPPRRTPQDQRRSIPAIIHTPTTHHVHLQEAGSTPLLQVVYPIPSVTHPDLPALQVLDLILTEGRNSRLEQSLVDAGFASQVNSYPASFQQGGWYSFWITPTPHRTLSDLKPTLFQSIQSLIQNGVSEAELHRAQRQLLAAVVLGNRDITSQAMQLGQDYCLTGDYQFSDRYLQRVNQLTPADIQQAAQTYLSEAQAIVGEFEPTILSDEEGEIGIAQLIHTPEQFGTGEVVNPAEVAQFFPNGEHAISHPPQLKQPEELSLPNGVRVLLLEDRSTPTVTLSGYLRAGSEFDTPDLAGLASLTADNLLSGTPDQDALTLARLLEDQGADLEVNANREGVLINGTGLCTDLQLLLSILGDILQYATFPESELAISRQQAITAVRMQQDDPARLGRVTIQQTLYPPGHPFHAFPTEESLGKITSQHLKQFYQTYYRPEKAVFTLIGHFQRDQVIPWLEQTLGQWSRSSSAPQLHDITQFPAPQATRVTRQLPNKTQAITYLGHTGIDRRDDRIYAAMLLNQIVGGDTLASRLGTEIRDRLGLTYGIYSYFQAGQYPGPFLVEMQTAPEDTDEAIRNTLRLLQSIHDHGVSEEELNAAKRTLSSNFAVDLAHPEQLAISWLMNTVYSCPQDELVRFPERLQAITLEELNRATQDLIRPQDLVIVSVGSFS